MNRSSKCADCAHRDVCYGAKVKNVSECSDYVKDSDPAGTNESEGRTK